MQCPKCAGTMVAVEHAGVTVDRCAACGGLWFDALEHLTLMKVDGAATVDVEPTRDAPESAPDIILCPVCGVAMDTFFDAYQHHIHYEKCPQGHGAYFDAGEFRDFVTHEWSDFFKGLFTRYPRN